MSFHVPSSATLERFGEAWDPRFVLVDCFTHGRGRAEETFTRFYRSRRARSVHVVGVEAEGADG